MPAHWSVSYTHLDVYKRQHPYIGNYDCVYTRNEKGRELLLEGRVKALANREERCISRKKGGTL